MKKKTATTFETMRDPQAKAEDRVSAAGQILDEFFAIALAELRRRIARLERNRNETK